MTQEQLKENLHYNPETGVFTRIIANCNSIKIGEIAGGQDVRGYIQIRVLGKNYKAHKLAWFYTYGVWPSKFLDHEDTNKSNNKINNLREATNSENQQNVKKFQKNNKLGFLGVVEIKNSKTNRYRANIQINNKSIHIGNFPTAEEAHEAYLNKKRELHPFNTL
jgi:hypothetical protein